MPLAIPMPTSITRSIRPCLLLSVAALWSAAAQAQTAAPRETPSFVADLLAIVLPLVFIIAGLLFVLRLARRRFGITGQDAPLSILQILPVGPRERIVLLRTRSERVIAIGVCAQSVTFVAQLDAKDVASRPVDVFPDDVAEEIGDTAAIKPTVPVETILAKTIRKGWPFGSTR